MKTPDIQLDLQRFERTGIEEAIYCEGKSVSQINKLLASALRDGRNLLLTRIQEEQYISIENNYKNLIDYDPVSATGILGKPVFVDKITRVSVICAGTSDIRVSREAVRTLNYHGQLANEISDVGVAGLWRLTSKLEEINRTPITIVVAGMDAALPSVLGGLYGGIIIAVPTSTGYGVSSGGTAALNAILASCASGITVMNIDNGFGAACAALRALNVLKKENNLEEN